MTTTDSKADRLDMDMSGDDGMPIGLLLTDLANAEPDRPSVTVDGETLSRRELDNRCNRRARAFADLGVKPQDVVVIMLQNGLEFIETTLALWKLGATPAPVSWRLPPAELEQIVDMLKPYCVFGADPELLPSCRVIAPGFEPDPALSDEPLPPAVALCWKAVASGGSTGRPKVVFDHMPSVWNSGSVVLGRQPGDVMINPGPLYHNGPFALSFLGLLGGAHLVCMRRFDAAEWLGLVERLRADWSYLVPTMMNRIWRLTGREKTDMSSLRMIVHMAAPCPIWLKRAWIDWLGPERIWETYAGTESIGGCINSGVEWLAHPGTVGRPMGDCRLLILDDNGSELPPGEIGEIFFSPSPTSGAGFHYIGGAPQERGVLKSYGDLGHVDADGYLYIADRRTDMIVSGGANIYPAEVESSIERHPLVRSCVAVGLPDDDLGQAVHAVVDIADNDLDHKSLLKFLRDQLVSYKLPRSIEFVSTPLRDDAGKVRRSRIRERCLGTRS